MNNNELKAYKDYLKAYNNNIDKPAFLYAGQILMIKFAYYHLCHLANGLKLPSPEKPTAEFTEEEQNKFLDALEIEEQNKFMHSVYEEYMNQPDGAIGYIDSKGKPRIVLSTFQTLSAWMRDKHYNLDLPPLKVPTAEQRDDEAIIKFLGQDTTNHD